MRGWSGWSGPHSRLGRISIELSTSPTRRLLNDVQTAVAGIENFPPVTADHPEVELQQLALEVMTLAVSSTAVSENGLRLAAENLRDELLELPSISQVKLKGTRDREISIELSEEELRRHNLTFNGFPTPFRGFPSNLTFGSCARTPTGWFCDRLQAAIRRGVKHPAHHRLDAPS